LNTACKFVCSKLADLCIMLRFHTDAHCTARLQQSALHPTPAATGGVLEHTTPAEAQRNLTQYASSRVSLEVFFSLVHPALHCCVRYNSLVYWLHTDLSQQC
jgi:hypothetical protein